MVRTLRKVIDVLLIEDNPGDAAVIMGALRDADVVTRITHLEDGAEAWAKLIEEDGGRRTFRPDLILLDMTLPGLSGDVLLERIKGDEVLRPVPVVVMGSSRTEELVRRCYSLHANCFIAKPPSPEEFARGVVALTRHWLEIARIPLRPG